MIEQKNGFTLVELMLTLAILGVLASLAAPSFTSLLERRELQGAGDNLFADLMFAKTEAIKRNKTIRVSFKGNGTTWCYGIKENSSCDCTASDCDIKVIDQDSFSRVSVLATSSFDGGSTSFTPLRGAANAGNLQFTVPSGAKIGVVVSSFGRIRMCGDSGGIPSCP